MTLDKHINVPFSKEEAKKLLGEYKEYDADYGKVINEKERQTLEREFLLF